MRETPFFIFAMLFLMVFSPLFSQTKAGARIYVPPVAGYGMPEDNEFFQQQVSYEVVLQYHETAKSKRTSQFTLKGLIEPYTGEVSAAAKAVHVPDNTHPVPPRPTPRVRNNSDRREFFSWEVDGSILFYDTSDDVNLLPPADTSDIDKFNTEDLEFIFYLALVNNATDQAIGEQYIIYKAIDHSVSEMVSVMVRNMLSSIPLNMTRSFSKDSRDKWLFLDVNLLWAPRLYTNKDYQSISWLNFGASVAAEFHFMNFMSLGAGVQISQDWIVVSEKKGDEYQDLILEVPFSLRFVLKPGNNYLIEPYMGISGNFSVIGNTKPSAFSWFLGCQIGFDMGPGMFIIDPRFAMDFFESSLPTSLEYRRYLMQIGIGYKFGFISK